MAAQRGSARKTHVNIVPFDGNPLHRPAKRPQEGHHSMGDQFILSREITKCCLVPVEARQVMHLGNESLQRGWYVIKRWFLLGQCWQWHSLPGGGR